MKRNSREEYNIYSKLENSERTKSDKNRKRDGGG